MNEYKMVRTVFTKTGDYLTQGETVELVAELPNHVYVVVVKDGKSYVVQKTDIEKR